MGVRVVGVDGGRLPTFEDFIRFSEVPDEDIAAYYADRLGITTKPISADNGSYLFDCPFHMDHKPRLSHGPTHRTISQLFLEAPLDEQA
jgi:hypothetical protein